MEAITYSHAREDLANTMDHVCDEHDIVVITRKAAKSVVMMSLEDYNSIQETAYLLQSPKNARKLRESIKEYETGNVIDQDIIE